MTNDELRKAAAVMLAAAEGKEIEYLDKKYTNEGYRSIKSPNWNWDRFSYRIKPPTIKYRLALVHFEYGHEDGTWSNKPSVLSFENEKQFERWNARYGDNFIRFLTDWIEMEINDE